jgi:low temperature requirement protein LtrA
MAGTMHGGASGGAPPIVPQLPIIRTGTEGEQRATFFELFFDLVYVFAVTQLSHYLLDDITWAGAAKTAFMLVALYWAWNYTTWMTNWFDPDTVPVRLVLVFVMLASLLMAVAIPQGFGDYALLFACAYSGLQIGRNTFVVAVTPRGEFNQNFRQILAWSLLSAPLWVAGGVVDSEALRWVLWLGALGLDLAAPLLTYWVPGAGSTPMSKWQIEGAHFGERFQLFVIIALGESIVVTGATTSELSLGIARLSAFGVAFLMTAAFWWLYFSYVAAIAQRRLELATERTTMARDGYTFLHVVLVAGIIVSAVGDEIVIAHPTETLHTADLVAVVAGPVIYLVGHVLFRQVMAGSMSGKRVAGVVACVGVGFLGLVIPALAVATLLLLVLVAIIAAEHQSGRRRRERGEPSPMQKLEASEATATEPSAQRAG